MFPYRDENETQHPAIVTAAIIILNVLVWIFVQGAGSTLSVARSVCELGLIPGELTLSLPVRTWFPLGCTPPRPHRSGPSDLPSVYLHVPTWFLDAFVG